MPEAIVDRQFLEKLERLTLHWQKSFNGLVGGHNPSLFAGSGQEFLDHRNFHYGDDLRAVNWRAYLRLEKLFLKMFQVEPRVPVRLLLDTSASMGVAVEPGTYTKFDYARRLAAALTYVGLVRLDSLLLQPFGNRLLEPLYCSGGRHRFQPAENYLRSLKPRGMTDFAEAARQFLTTYPQRGLTIIISDFLGDSDCLKPLQYIADFGHELLLIQLWSDEDRDPDTGEDCELIDAESGKRLRVISDDKTRKGYRRAFDEYAEQINRLALRNKGRYFGFSTTTDIENILFSAAFTARKRKSLSTG
jgi:uncharacterized protein (DUF58 family)